MLNSIKEVKLKPTKYLLSLIIVILLAAVMVVPALAQTEGDTVITANLQESITINAPTGAYHLTLSANTDNQTLIAATGNVTANVDYDVTAVDKMEDTKAGGDAGYMVEHWDTTWGATKLTNQAEAGSSMTTYGVAAAAISATPITIISNAPAGTDVDSEEVVQITTVGGDAPLATADHWYQITITFTASKHS